VSDFVSDFVDEAPELSDVVDDSVVLDSEVFESAFDPLPLPSPEDFLA
jgi:hypothetical protein